MKTNSKSKTRWIVADLSPEANRRVAQQLGSDCEENAIESFRTPDGEEHQGYYVPNHRFFSVLRAALRGVPGNHFLKYKQEGERFVRVPF